MKKLIARYTVEKVEEVEIEVSDEEYNDFNNDNWKEILLFEKWGDYFLSKVKGFKHNSFSLRSQEKESSE
jgi:hypothetical protein